MFRRSISLLAFVAVPMLVCTLHAPEICSAAPRDEDRPSAVQEVGDPSRYDEPPRAASAPAGARPLSPASLPAGQRINYQGYVTDALGVALSGPHDFQVSLWDDPAAGVRFFGPENHNAVPVTHGLFQFEIGTCGCLYADIFDRPLYLEVVVDGTTLPRQPLRAVPHGLGLAPGASVEGSPVAGNRALTVQNTNAAANQDGLYAEGSRYGLYVLSSNGSEAIYSDDYINSQGYRSRSDTYVYVPGIEGQPLNPATLDVNPSGSFRGRVDLSGTNPGGSTAYFYIPITVPGVLYGQDVTVEQATVFYINSSIQSYITETSLHRLEDADTELDLFTDVNNRISTSATSYSITPSANTVLSSSSGPLTLRLALFFSNDVQVISIAGVRLRLGHVPAP